MEIFMAFSWWKLTSQGGYKVCKSSMGFRAEATTFFHVVFHGPWVCFIERKGLVMPPTDTSSVHEAMKMEGVWMRAILTPRFFETVVQCLCCQKYLQARGYNLVHISFALFCIIFTLYIYTVIYIHTLYVFFVLRFLFPMLLTQGSFNLNTCTELCLAQVKLSSSLDAANCNH